FTGCNRTRHFIRKVNVSGCVNKIQSIFLTLIYIVHLYSVAINRNASFTLKIHAVKYLCLKICTFNSFGKLQQTICQSTLSMINMSYDTKVSYILHLLLKICIIRSSWEWDYVTNICHSCNEQH